MASDSFITNSYAYISELFSGVLKDVIVALVILIVGFILGKIIGRIVEKAFKAIDLDKGIKKTSGIRYSVSAIIGTVVAYVIYLVTILLALDQLKLTQRIIMFIAIIAVIIIIIAVLLSIKDFIPNFIAGLTLNNKGLIDDGDFLKIKDMEGVVEKIGLLETIIRTKSDEIIYIPNSTLAKSEFIKIKKVSKKHSTAKKEL